MSFFFFVTVKNYVLPPGEDRLCLMTKKKKGGRGDGDDNTLLECAKTKEAIAVENLTN